MEYTYNFKSELRNSLRFSYKYDFLLKSEIKPSNMLQFTWTISVGAGYFTNFDKRGFFPEISYGYSIRNHKLLIYPHIKFRHTFMKKDIPDISDFSFGIIFGIANPFVDLKIRREH